MRVLVIALLMAVLAGCASSGTKMDASLVDQIEPGETSKSEMLAKFGQPMSQNYDSEGRLTLMWYYMHVGPFGTNMEQQNLVAVFNDEDKLERFNLLDGASPGTRLGY